MNSSKKLLLPMLAIAGFLGMSLPAHADRDGGRPTVRSPEPSAVVSFLVLAGMAYAVKRRISNKESASRES